VWKGLQDRREGEESCKIRGRRAAEALSAEALSAEEASSAEAVLLKLRQPRRRLFSVTSTEVVDETNFWDKDAAAADSSD
jgi:hypothetical protein